MSISFTDPENRKLDAQEIQNVDQELSHIL